MPKFRSTRRKKIKFHGNRHTRLLTEKVEDDVTSDNTPLPLTQNTPTQDPDTSNEQSEDSLNISHTKLHRLLPQYPQTRPVL